MKHLLHICTTAADLTIQLCVFIVQNVSCGAGIIIANSYKNVVPLNLV